ncbi:glycoside hydrolase family 2 TIM barrel-domain containing protein [Paraglaciecola sp. L3A3]|uniref:glycoside hydrolase family 2 TIM barrel-domain containing protein n=1 Tax=Paraglaciecola sp. L3A3 TaxID=2686358 RepID=UPI0018EF006F|nr:glycoside hydrolase family 2 TIM barrel-domain containing protein [Paraglaciecola sp. L3A3]
MSHAVKYLLLIISIFIVSCTSQVWHKQVQNQRQEIDFNFAWKFSLSADDTAYLAEYDDSQWREVRLPHDWSIEADYAEQGRAGATGYLPGGTAWYRKTFTTPNDSNKTQIVFDGVYNHSKVWVNGYFLGERPYGYAPFYYDLTPYLHTNGKKNVLAVFVDHSRYVDSRWYTGSGIYRNVKLISTNKTHIPIWGSYVTTPDVSKSQATVLVKTTIQNDAITNKKLMVVTELKDAAGNILTTVENPVTVSSTDGTKINQTLDVNNPELWSPDSPTLYSVVIRLKENGNILDSNTVSTGFRYFVNDPQQGFFLNGKSMKIKGVNIHHDGGLVGAAVPKGVWKRRLQTLKDAGVNAIRTAHNPASAEFLDLCDEMGFLVQAEAFDEWDNRKDKRKNFNQTSELDYITQSYSQYFAKWAERDLKAMLYRDRNHPSIFQWSIGNEIEWTYPRYTSATGYWDKNNSGKYNYYWDEPPYSQAEIEKRFNASAVKGAELAKTAANLAKWTREVDTTRPITANLVTPSVSHFSGYAEVLDVIGYSYRQSIYERGHQHYPNKMIMGTENWVQWHEWQTILDKAYIPGIFVWTGINYLGESNGDWPTKGSGSGMLDFAGFTKPSYHMMKSIWSDEPHIYITTQPLADSAYQVVDDKVIEKESGNWKQVKWGWPSVNHHWNYSNNENIAVEVYTNQPGVELFLNDKSLGVRYLKDNPDHILKWSVPFNQGKLTAKTVNGKYSHEINTAGEPVAVKLSVDKPVLNADNYDVAHITAQLLPLNLSMKMASPFITKINR